MSKGQEDNNQKKPSFWERPDVIKFKGAIKVAFGGLVILQPHYAFLIGGAICAGGIGASVYNKVKNRSWGRMAEDFRDGTFWTELKDTLGMGTGSTIGLLSPITGLVVAGVGAVSYLAGYGQGVEGLFKGGLMASTVAVTLPVIGGAFIAEGLANAVMGKDYNLISKSLEYSKSVFKSVANVVGIAEANKENPKEAVKAAHGAFQDISSAAKEATQEVRADIKNAGEKAQNTINQADITKGSKSWVAEVVNTLTHPSELFHRQGNKSKVEKLEEQERAQSDRGSNDR